MEIDEFKGMNPKYNVLYFGNKYDVRLIPKNCSTTIKILWCYLNGFNIRHDENNPHGVIPDDAVTQTRRKTRVIENGNKTFRGGAKKVTVKRDPIERWVSAINFCIKMRDHRGSVRDYAEFSKLKWVDMNINDVVSYQQENGPMVAELLSQSYCGGDLDKYSHVYTKETFSQFIDLLDKEFNTKFPRVVSTRTDHNGKWKIEDLTEESIVKLKEIYEVDYRLGWY